MSVGQNELYGIASNPSDPNQIAIGRDHSVITLHDIRKVAAEKFEGSIVHSVNSPSTHHDAFVSDIKFTRHNELLINFSCQDPALFDLSLPFSSDDPRSVCIPFFFFSIRGLTG